MRICFIGTGAAFTTQSNYQSNMFLEIGDRKLLIDCGSDCRHGLHELGMGSKDIDSVFISHLHADHIGGLEWLAFTSYFDSNRQKKINLFLRQSLVDPLWRSLSSGLQSLDEKEADLSTYFNVRIIKDDGDFVWEGLTIHTFHTVHQISNGKLMPSYGLFFKANNKNVLISCDSRFPTSEQPLYKFYPKADLIFHDCEICNPKTTLHAHYDELKTLDPSIKAKMWLYHYQSSKLPDPKREGFLGFVQKGQSFDLGD
jgi:ribonuclease BN (tRNA processing enzyme)